MADTHAGHCPCFEDGAGQALPPTSELGVIMPCVMYVDHGDGILQFQEARAVKQPLQHVLCFQSTLSSKEPVADCKGLASRFMDSTFFFVATKKSSSEPSNQGGVKQPGTPGQYSASSSSCSPSSHDNHAQDPSAARKPKRSHSVRGFKVVRPGSGGYLLQEVLDKGVLSASWKRFRQAALLRVSVEKDMCVPEAYGQALWGGGDRLWPVGLDPESSGGAGLLTSCFTVLPRDDRAMGGIRVSVPVFSVLLSYEAVSKTKGCGNEFGWGRFTNEGRIIFRDGCNVYASYINLPARMPAEDLYMEGPGYSEQDRVVKLRRRVAPVTGGADEQEQQILAERMRYHRQKLVRVVVDSISVMNQKSMCLCQMLDGRVFRVPISSDRGQNCRTSSSRFERKGMHEWECGERSQRRPDLEGIHDDEVPTPDLQRVREAQGSQEMPFLWDVL